MIRTAGVGAGTLSMAAILAACSGDEGGGTGDGRRRARLRGGLRRPRWTGVINFANWPLYIDKANKDGEQKIHPSLDKFTKETGIDVNYQDVIKSNAGVLRRDPAAALQAGEDTGWDIIVITNGRELTAMTRNEWVVELDPSKRPNFDANAADFAKDPVFDPGNKYHDGMAVRASRGSA